MPVRIVTYIRGSNPLGRIHALVEGRPLHLSYPIVQEPWAPSYTGEGKHDVLSFCFECEKLPEMAEVGKLLKAVAPEGSITSDETAEPGLYADWYGTKWVCSGPGRWAKLGKGDVRPLNGWPIAPPLTRVGPVPDVSDAKKTWRFGREDAVPVMVMTSMHIRNAVALCDRAGFAPDCYGELVAELKRRTE